MRTLDLDPNFYKFSHLEKILTGDKKDKNLAKEIRIALPSFKGYELRMEADKFAFQPLDDYKVSACCNTVYSTSNPWGQIDDDYKGTVTSILSSQDGKFVVAGFQNGKVIIFEYVAVFNKDDETILDSDEEETKQEGGEGKLDHLEGT